MNLPENHKLNSTVAQIIPISPTMKIFRIKPNAWDLPDFEPGKFLVLGLYGQHPRVDYAEPEFKKSEDDKLIRRAYSIASSPRDGFVEFFISMVDTGQLTPRLFNLKAGDQIFMSQKPSGMFTLDRISPDQNVVLIATGTGVAPYMSMLRSDALSRNAKIAIIHGASISLDLGYHSDMELLERLFPDKFTYYPTITDPEKEIVEWHGDTRFIEDIWNDKNLKDFLGFTPKPDNTHIMLCGNPNMITSMKHVLIEQGFKEHTKREPGQIHAEEF